MLDVQQSLEVGQGVQERLVKEENYVGNIINMHVLCRLIPHSKDLCFQTNTNMWSYWTTKMKYIKCKTTMCSLHKIHKATLSVWLDFKDAIIQCLHKCLVQC